jgi:S1-C subfamily serine protease
VITSGSGVIIQKRGNVYTLLTNLHVLQFADRYVIMTPDGLQYTPLILSRSVQFGFGNNDMAIAQFQSSQQYEIAQIKREPLQIGDRVFAAGFPIYQVRSLITTFNLGMQAFHFTEGRISMLPAKSLAQGYQIGYSNDIVVGMSGGPIFDASGFLVGINGRIKNRDPDFGDYTFADGTEPTSLLLQQMLNASWGVPISTYLQFTSIHLNNSLRS